MGQDVGEGKDERVRADPRVLGQLLAAQNVVGVLPTPQHVAEFYARALVSVPGVNAARVCFPDASAQEGECPDDPCAACPGLRRARGDGTFSRDLGCALGELPSRTSIALETAAARYGFLVVHVERPELFEPYRPFLHDMGNVLALSLENQLQRQGLERSRDALERRVEERTEELRTANRKLEEEIEHRRRAEAAVRKLNVELEERVRDRTVQLQASNEELEAFAYSVSHDLRAPLRHVLGFLELLQKRAAGSLDAQSQHYVETVVEAATRMSALIDDLLSFSRMGRFELSRAPVDLRELVDDVVRELEQEAKGRAVRWHVGDLPVVTGDRAMLRVVLVNLVSNALKFTRPRAPAEIEIGSEPGSAQEVVVYVRDNGVGFDMAYADKLFGVFKRLHRATDFEGNGVGLANVRRIVSRHGGRAWAEGAVDRGATLRFSLPRG